jgi:hypothetical protein
MRLKKKRKLLSNVYFLVVFAWNPNSNALSYHGGNRGKALINFFSSGVSTSSKDRLALLMHGIWMFAVNKQILNSNFCLNTFINFFLK